MMMLPLLLAYAMLTPAADTPLFRFHIRFHFFFMPFF